MKLAPNQSANLFRTRRSAYQVAAILMALLQICAPTLLNSDQDDQRSTVQSTTKLYFGHFARLTAQIPVHWTIDLDNDFTYSGTDGFVSSQAVPAPDLETACTQVAASTEAQLDSIDLTYSTWRGSPVCKMSIELGAPSNYSQSIVMVFPHPLPFDILGVTYQFAMLSADSKHFPSIQSSTSFTLDQVTPQGYTTSVLRIIESRALYSREVDWQHYWEQASQATNWPSAHATIEQVLFELRFAGDNHSDYLSPDDTSDVAQPLSSDLPTGRRIESNIGYIQLFATLQGGRMEYIHKAHSIISNIDRKPTCGWILDLRDNSGGSTNAMVQAVGPLLSEGRIFGYVFPSGRTEWVEYRNGTLFRDGIQVEPAVVTPSLKNPEAPVAILVGPETASAGELTAISFIGGDNTRVFGSSTAGFTTANQVYPLLNGNTLILAIAHEADRNGKIYYEGVTPDEFVPTRNGDYEYSSDAVTNAAAAWLKQQQSCQESELLTNAGA